MAHPRLVCQCFADGMEQDVTPRICRCAIDARHAGVRAEDLVVAIREAWHAQPNKSRRSPPREALLTDLINTALEAYYREQASGPLAN